VSGLVAVGLTNAASATLLALVAAGVARFVRRPALVHGLWLLVLLELLTPPVLVVSVLPTLDRTEPAAKMPAVASEVAAVALTLSEPPVVPAPVGQALTWGQLASGVWIVCAAALLLLAIVRGVRFERLLGRGGIAPSPLRARAETLARSLGLRRAPLVRLVPARVSPLLWFRPGRMEIVFPAALVERLEPAQLDALLAHELAHVRRGDHWVRFLELAASALFFWHPVVWWARARMRSAEERSCDVWVATVLPGRARDYAAGVVKALEFLSPLRGPVLPALASGVARFRSLEERLAMILSHRTPPLATRKQRIALAAAGIGLLVLFPGAAHRSADDPQEEAAREADTARADEATTNEMRSIQAELERIESRRLELAQRLRELQVRGDQAQLREEISRLESEGRLDEARRVEAKAELLERQAQLDLERVALERGRREDVARLELEQVEARRQLERALAAGASEQAAEAKQRLAELDAEHEERSFAVEQRALALESLMRKAEVEAAARQAEQLSSEGRFDEAEQLERDAALMKLELELAEQGQHANRDAWAFEHEARAMELRAQELAGQGEGLEADALRQKAAEMRRAIDDMDLTARERDIQRKIAQLEAEIERLVELGVEGGVTGGVRGGVTGGVRGGVGESRVDALRQAVQELERALEDARRRAGERGTIY
jgi:beta-lactamase regulating signal transducer with metallopeptidase domain